MARHYSPKSFFRHAPNAMLMTYFAQQGVLGEHDFSSTSETKIEPMYKAWLTLPDAQRGAMERHFKEIDALACEGGIKAILDEAEWHGESLGEVFADLEGFHEKAFWVFLERPQFWGAAIAFCHADSISTNQWSECKTINHAPARVDEKSIKDLEHKLSHYFHHHEGRGRNCMVEPYRRGKLDYFFAYPEDYAQSSVEWDEATFKRSARRPAFEIIFVYAQDEGKISLYMKGNKALKMDVRALFADTILGLELGEFVEDVRVYDLSPLQNSHPVFKFSPDSGIQSVAIKKFRLAINGTRERITLEVNPTDNPNAIYDLRDRLCRDIPPSQMAITQVGIVVTHMADPETGRTRTRSFDINWPNSCSLKHDGKDAMIRQMLIASGLEPQSR